MWVDITILIMLLTMFRLGEVDGQVYTLHL